jgi:hypothetical protein
LAYWLVYRSFGGDTPPTLSRRKLAISEVRSYPGKVGI